MVVQVLQHCHNADLPILNGIEHQEWGTQPYFNECLGQIRCFLGWALTFVLMAVMLSDWTEAVR